MQGDIETIKPYVDDFIEFASKNYGKTFYVTRIGCGIAGFKDEEIAPLFTKALHTSNIRLPETFVKAIARMYRDKGEKVLTPWPVKKYGVYNLLVDMALACGGNTADEKLRILEQNIGIAMRRDFLGYPNRDLTDYLIANKSEILSGRNTDRILLAIAEFIGIWHHDVVAQAVYRYFSSKVYQLAYLMFRTHDFSKRISIGFAIATDFNYAFYGTITGRWNCGDNSYMYEDIETCAKFFLTELREHKDEISIDGVFDRNKFLTFASQPYIWKYCHENDNHKATEVDMIFSVLHSAESIGEYKYIEDYLVPAHDFSRPVYQVGNNKQRLKFPTYFIKEQFIKGMLAK